MFDEGVEALYLDLPLNRPESAHVSDSLAELQLSYSGIFPNNQAAGDVLRLQCLRDATAWSHDVAVASPHGAALLEYVIADMEAVGQRVERKEVQLGVGPSDESVLWWQCDKERRASLRTLLNPSALGGTADCISQNRLQCAGFA